MNLPMEVELNGKSAASAEDVRLLPIGETGKYINGLAFKPGDWADEGLPIIRIQNLTDPTKEMNRTTRVVDPVYLVQSGELLVSWSATLDAFIWDREPALLNQHIFKVVPDTNVVSRKYLFFALRHAIVEMSKTEHLHGSTMKHINRGPFLAHRIRVPPKPQQAEIVAEIEKQFSRLDEAVANLQRVKANLRRYEATVLRDAVLGKLVVTTRGQLPAESAKQLLDRLQAERSHKRQKGRRSEPPIGISSVAGLPDSPPNWSWATLDELGQEGRPVIYGIIKPGPDAPDGVPYVRVTEMKDGFVDVPSLRRAAKEREAKFARARLKAGDLLISKDGTIGRVAVVPPELEGGNITQHVMRAPIHPLMNRDYVMWAIRSDLCQRWLSGETKGVALRGVNVEDFRRLPIPVPPRDEQDRIVAEVERRLSIVRSVEAEVDANLKRAQALRQAVLARVFWASTASA